MPVDRPTFSESWYRVAGLRPRLRPSVQAHRQHFRGQMWHVLQDPATNQFYRLNDPAYYFVALLDGRKTVAEVWKLCNEQLGDSAPTQGEAIQLLGQLYTTNLLHAELPPDAESLFQRYHKRKTREVQSYLTNLLFIRLPLFDPDRFLERWVRVAGKVFSSAGLVLWLALIGTGLYFLAGRGGELTRRASGILDPDNLLYLYVGMALIKVCHEFGHAFACKKFGRQSGTGGEVHVMGVMFLIFTPLPYVDASSAWALRSKWHRVIVGAGGMLVELGVAAVAVIVWAHTAEGSPIREIAYNMIFIAGVSTVLFNANPLLRYDGYYILSDVLEIPNLAQRGKDYLYYLIRRYAWGVRRPQNPAHSRGEKFWLSAYAISSSIYRVFVCVAILLFVAKKLFFVGVILAVAAGVSWVVIPLGKFAHYLATSGELDRVRWRAAASTLCVVVLFVAGVGLVPAPNRFRIEGFVDPVRVAFVHAETEGFVRWICCESGREVKRGEKLLEAENRELAAELGKLLAGRRQLEVRKQLAELEDLSAAQGISRQLAAVNEQIQWVEQQVNSLTLKAPMDGQWVAPEIERSLNAWLSRGDKVGVVASGDDVVIRAIAGQDVAAALLEEIEINGREDVRLVAVRMKGRPEPDLRGRIEKILPAGQEQLPSAALGYMAGGTVQTAADDRQGTKAAERFFEIQIKPEMPASATAAGPGGPAPLLRIGQRVVIRVELSSEPLIVQWWRSALRLFQRRFQI